MGKRSECLSKLEREEVVNNEHHQQKYGENGTFFILFF